jgi:hypothetical protein
MPVDVSAFYTKIDTIQYGPLEFKGFMLEDFEWLRASDTQAFPVREFAIQFLYARLVSPELNFEEVQGWPDDFLAYVATHWLKGQMSQTHEFSAESLSFEAFKQTLYNYGAELEKQFGETVEGILGTWGKYTAGLANTLSLSIRQQMVPLNQIARTLAGLSSMIQQIVTGTHQLIANTIQNLVAQRYQQLDILNQTTLNLFANLPNLAEMQVYLDKLKEVEQGFEQSGFGFTSHIRSTSFTSSFANVNLKVRSAVITNKLAYITRSKRFETQLEHLFQQSPVLRRRWKIVARALDRHRERDYLMSVPVLLAQVEGIIGDALILRELILRKGHKLYVKDSNGKLKLNSKGKPIEVRGMHSLIDNSDFQQHPVLQKVAELITAQLVDDRNPILHGRRTSYGTAKLSVQTLLLLLVLADEFIAFEKSQAQP